MRDLCLLGPRGGVVGEGAGWGVVEVVGWAGGMVGGFVFGDVILLVLVLVVVVLLGFEEGGVGKGDVEGVFIGGCVDGGDGGRLGIGDFSSWTEVKGDERAGRRKVGLKGKISPLRR